jgi:hypothetical protein
MVRKVMVDLPAHDRLKEQNLIARAQKGGSSLGARHERLVDSRRHGLLAVAQRADQIGQRGACRQLMRLTIQLDREAIGGKRGIHQQTPYGLRGAKDVVSKEEGYPIGD